MVDDFEDCGSVERANEGAELAARALRDRFGAPAEAVVIAGSGLGAFVESLEDADACPYAELAGFPAPGVQGHAGRASVGRIGGRRVLILSGRSHLYEGWEPAEAVAPVRAARLWGCEMLVVTNAAGGVNPLYRPGDLMLIADHLNLTMRSPLRGLNRDDWGPRFPDMSEAYDPRLRRRAHEGARIEGVALREGVYAANLGPAFETPAEGRMLRLLGVDAVGMSTAPETLAARHMGLRVLGISYISNSLVHKPEGQTTHEEVLGNSSLAIGPLTQLLGRFFREGV